MPSREWRWTLLQCECGRLDAADCGRDMDCRYFSGDEIEVVPAPGPGTRAYLLTDEEVRFAQHWIKSGVRADEARGESRGAEVASNILRKLRAGLDDSDE